MKVAIVLKTSDDGTIKILSATGKELKAVEMATKSASKQTGFFSNQWHKMAGYAAAYMSLGFANSLLREADSIGKVSKKLGISASALQEYRYAAKIAGVETRTFDMATQRFTRRVGEAVKGTGEAKEALKTLGIQLTDNTGVTRKTEELMLDVADALKGVTDPAERLRLAFKLFDSEGVAMINMMTDGADGLKNMRAEAQRLGIVMSGKTIKSAEDATDQFTALADVFKVNMATGFIAVLDVASPLITILANLFSEGETWAVIIGGLATVLTAKLVPALIAVAIAAPWLTAIGISVTAIGAGVVNLQNKISGLNDVTLTGLRKNITDIENKITNLEIGGGGGIFTNDVVELETLKAELIGLKALRDKIKNNDNGVNKNPLKGEVEKNIPPIRSTGLNSGFKDWAENSKSELESFANVAKKSMQSFEDAMVKAAMTGKFQFKDMANSIIADLIRIQIRKSITKPLSDALGKVDFGKIFGGGATTKKPGYADGGYIGATDGSARSDGQTIAVSGSEYIVNARATAKHLPLLEQINNGSFKKFANGGAVNGSYAPAQANNMQVNVTVKDATGGEVKIKASKPVKRAGGGFDIELLAQAVTGINANKASRSEDPYQDIIASNAGLSLDGGSW